MKKKKEETLNEIETPKTRTKRIVMPNGETIEANVDSLDMEMLKYRLDFDMGDSYAGLEAFIKAFEKGFHPPLWTIEWIFHGFRNYKQHYYRWNGQSNGKPKKKSLDDFLGLSSKKRLTEPEKRFIDEKNLNLFMAVSSLIVLGIEPKRAFLEVSNMTRREGLSHTPGNIRKNFFHHKRIYPGYIEKVKKEIVTWTEAHKKDFLSLYNLSEQ